MRNCRSILCAAGALGLVLTAGAASAHEVTFRDISEGGASGLTFSHAPAARYFTLRDDYRDDNAIDVPTEYVPGPFKPYGSPGVAIFDHDNDGDLDIFVANGADAPNALFSNQLRETGRFEFVDVASLVGVELREEEAQGVCYGDTDNDGDHDLLVLGFNGAHHFFENENPGHQFTDITALTGIDSKGGNSTSCAMGDINGDGLLDIALANTFDFTHMPAVTTEPIVHSQPNQLFLNLGDNRFQDVSVSSGIRTKTVAAQIPNDITWTASFVDYDKDGDVDLFFANDMRGAGFADTFLMLYENDGTGHFTDITGEAGLRELGSWRGLTFGDFNCDNRIDLFATNLGDYIFFPGTVPAGTFSSAWFLQQADGTFARQSPGDLVTVPTGWGASAIDYDNDGDHDIVFHGGQDNLLFWDASNPGVVLNNPGCTAEFTWDQQALGGPTKHSRRNVEGLATGDLNDDGFEDVVTVAGFDIADDTVLAPLFSNPLSSVFDVAGFGVYITVPTADPNVFAFQGQEPEPGTLAVEINSADNGHNWAKVNLLGTAGLVTGGRTNRDGIGAVVSYTRPPAGPGLTVVKPVVGGSSAFSQNALELVFGLDDSRRGAVEVTWTGGHRNRLYGVRLGERVTIPEIPCDIGGEWESVGKFATCVINALNELRDAGLVDDAGHVRHFLSNLHGYFDENGLPF